MGDTSPFVDTVKNITKASATTSTETTKTSLSNNNTNTKQNRRSKRNNSNNDKTSTTIASSNKLKNHYKKTKKKTIKEEILSSNAFFQVINRIVRGVMIGFTWYYCVIILLDGSTLYYCKEYRSSSNAATASTCPNVVDENILLVNDNNRKKWWNKLINRKSKDSSSFIVEDKETQTTSQNDINNNDDDDLWKENLCTNSLQLLEQMRYKVRFLRFVRTSNNHHSNSNNIAESATSCPQQRRPAITSSSSLHLNKEKKKEILLKRLVNALFTKSKRKKQSKSSIESSQSDDNHEMMMITAEQHELIKKLSLQIPQYINNKGSNDDNNEMQESFETRVEKVHWGGSNSNNHNGQWWTTSPSSNDNIKGYSLLYSYLKIMEWPQDLITNFPFKPCKRDNNCPASHAIYHTLLFREAYQPWLVTPSMTQENKLGFIYNHGYNPQDKAIFVWYTPGLQKPNHHESYIRCIVHAFETAIYQGLTKFDGAHGKYHVILDCTNFSLSLFPNFHDVKRLVTIFQDHFPNALGKIIVVNANTPTTMFYNLLWPLLTDCVRKKFLILQNKDKSKRLKELKELMGDSDAFIPTHLGGKDDFVFDVDNYYNDNGVFGTDDMAIEYLTRMPYHA